jgi:hypothetical protein
MVILSGFWGAALLPRRFAKTIHFTPPSGAAQGKKWALHHVKSFFLWISTRLFRLKAERSGGMLPAWK